MKIPAGGCIFRDLIRTYMKTRFKIWIPVVAGLISISCSRDKQPDSLLEGMGLQVRAEDNRETAFTDKESAYFYTRTHLKDPDYFSGWNVATHRVFSDYRLSAGGKELDRAQSAVTVYPDRLVREFGQVTETFRMFDGRKVLSIGLDQDAGPTGISLKGDLKFLDLKDGIALFSPADPRGWILAAGTVTGAPLTRKDLDGILWLESESPAAGFFLTLDSAAAGAVALLESARSSHENWTRQRISRLESLLKNNYFRSDSPETDLAVKWMVLTLDGLVTRQTGEGIYAGLPWFNDYWGRDMFISFAGTVLVTGQFDVARRILMSFADYQNTDENSRYFGRVPNRVRPGDIIYNTTDGTPRFVLSLYDYIRYSGDTALVRQLYPAVKRAADGPIRYWMDANGYLTHDDADTWMDAKIDNRIPLSPRGNRANDIQSLWYHQLRVSVRFAEMTGDSVSAMNWKVLAEKVKARFEADFVDPEQVRMADRLKPDGRPDYTFRPNQFFCLDFVSSDTLRWQLTRKAWENLVYPWGVASLWQGDPNFHPYHTAWKHYPADYHKDWAYHNGTVWLWNNGIAMDRMLEAGQIQPAWELFSAMTRQAVAPPGAVGALSELTDAFPPEGGSLPRLSGTFSQAWSMAEVIRVWYQGFLGLQPDAPGRLVRFTPQIPDSLSRLEFQIPLFNGSLKGSFRRSDGTEKWTLLPDSLTSDVTFQIKFPEFELVPAVVYSGEKLILTQTETELSVQLMATTGEIRAERILFPVPEELSSAESANRIFKGLKFAAPEYRGDVSRLQRPPDWSGR